MSQAPLESPRNAAQGSQLPGASLQVWDLPLRLFHWLLVLSILAAFLTAELGGAAWADWHGRIGAFVLGLLIFRLIWGVVGTQHARFGSFLPTPAQLAAYFKGRWQGHGHSPLGAMAVLALLLVVAAQVATGLFANDDIAFAGPLSGFIAKATSDALSGWHRRIFNVLAAFIALHIVAIAFYRWIRKTDLVGPMVTGRKIVPAGAASRLLGEAAGQPSRLWWRFAAALTLSVAIVWSVFNGVPAEQAEAATLPAATTDW